jgi:hypothetical protein
MRHGLKEDANAQARACKEIRPGPAILCRQVFRICPGRKWAKAGKMTCGPGKKEDASGRVRFCSLLLSAAVMISVGPVPCGQRTSGAPSSAGGRTGPALFG